MTKQLTCIEPTRGRRRWSASRGDVGAVTSLTLAVPSISHALSRPLAAVVDELPLHNQSDRLVESHDLYGLSDKGSERK